MTIALRQALFSKKLDRDAADRTLCRDACRTARAQNVRPCSFWSFAAILDQ
jgi:hypothetical protein